MNFLYLIKSFFNFETYLKYRHHIKLDKDKDKEIFYLFKALDNLYKHTQTDITFEDFSIWVSSNLGYEYTTFLNLIEKQETNSVLITEVLKSLKERNIAYEIAQVALAVNEGRKSVEELQDLFSSLQEHEEESESPFVEISLKDYYEERTNSPGFRWRLNTLNRSIGPLRKGDFGFIFARPETGKTTFLASEVSHFAEQTTSPIIWFNNEQGAGAVIARFKQASLGLTDKQLSSDPEAYELEFKARTNNTFKFIDDANIHKHFVENICKTYKPSLIVFDQLDKIKGFNNDRDDLRLGSIYIWARELAKTYCPVIGVCQADATGEGKKYLTMDNVANAKTAKQAEADWALGIGASHDNGFELIRHLNIVKNKLPGDDKTDPRLRHGKFDVLIQPEIARYKDI